MNFHVTRLDIRAEPGDCFEKMDIENNCKSNLKIRYNSWRCIYSLGIASPNEDNISSMITNQEKNIQKRKFDFPTCNWFAEQDDASIFSIKHYSKLLGKKSNVKKGKN